KWIVFGATFGIVPFFLFYALPYWLGVIPSPWMESTVFPMVLVPLTFGYAIVKYRLMDVDIIFNKGMAATLASLAVVGFYFALIGFLSEVVLASCSSRVYVFLSLVEVRFA